MSFFETQDFGHQVIQSAHAILLAREALKHSMGIEPTVDSAHTTISPDDPIWELWDPSQPEITPDQKEKFRRLTALVMEDHSVEEAHKVACDRLEEIIRAAQDEAGIVRITPYKYTAISLFSRDAELGSKYWGHQTKTIERPVRHLAVDRDPRNSPLQLEAGPLTRARFLGRKMFYGIRVFSSASQEKPEVAIELVGRT